jgi:cytochrome oxidase Cu insertion factor (SCO1/SenC/PrrC family)
MRRLARARFAVAGIALATTLAAGPAAAADPAAAMIGRPAPPFRLTDVLSGKTVALEDLRGRTIVLHFGASW